MRSPHARLGGSPCPVVCIAARVKENGGWTRHKQQILSPVPGRSRSPMTASFPRIGGARLIRRALWTRGSRRTGPIRRRPSRRRRPRAPVSSAIRAQAFAGTYATTWCSASSPDAPTVAIACQCGSGAIAQSLLGPARARQAARQPDSDYLLDHTSTHPLPCFARSSPRRASQMPRSNERGKRTGRSAQEPGGSETLVTVHIIETTTAENPSGVATGS